MEHLNSRTTSWLSLVAETAGVAGATIARVEVCLQPSAVRQSGPLCAVVQLQDLFGNVVGQTQIWGEEADFLQGQYADLGCDLSSTRGAQVVAWFIDDESTPSGKLQAPAQARRCSFDVTRAMKLMLSQEGEAIFDAA
jgi:hypothetical protein